MPKDTTREFLTGPTKFYEIMEKLEIIVNEMMADDGPVPMDLGNVGVHDTKTTQSDSDTSNDMSYEDVCAIAWKGHKAGKGAGKNVGTDRECGIVQKELMKGRVALEMTEARKEARRRAVNLTMVKARARARVKPDAATIA